MHLKVIAKFYMPYYYCIGLVSFTASIKRKILEVILAQTLFVCGFYTIYSILNGISSRWTTCRKASTCREKYMNTTECRRIGIPRI
jgi:hypothetical protein